jgi:L-lactate dehydrogenase (cytochrome)
MCCRDGWCAALSLRPPAEANDVPQAAFSRCHNIESLRVLARRRLPKAIFDFMDGGAEDEESLRRNTEAFRNYELIPDTLVDVSAVDTKVTLLGKSISLPLILSPTGASKLFHHRGEMAVARAAARAGTFYCLSTMSNVTLEDVAASCSGPRIFQLYVFRDRGITNSLVERCAAVGYDALCLTVDMPIGGNRERDIANRLQLPFKPSLAILAGLAAHPSWSMDMLFRVKMETVNFNNEILRTRRPGQSPMHFVNTQFDRSVTWKDCEWFASRCRVPFIVKGVLSVEDAKRAAGLGAAAIMVSNHGGRQMDAVPAPIDLIADIRDAVSDRLEIILDGGVRRGTHVIKALARGATACSVGRAYLYGLAAAGEAGVDKALALLKGEIERDMTLMGCRSTRDIARRHVRMRPLVHP